MFAPAKIITPENIGTIELFGTGLAVMIALKELNIKYIHKASMPESAELYEFSPFGTIPVLVHRPNAIYSARDRIALFETLAIARYLDEILSSKDVEDPSHRTLFPPPIGSHERNYADVALSRVEIDQISALIVTRVQPIVEDRYVKPFFALRNNGASKEDISAALLDSFQAAEEIFVLLERVIANTQEQLKLSNPPFIFGNLSWADVFLFPVARDFKATNPDLFTASRLPWLSGWFSRFEQRPSAQATLPTSFAASK